MGYKISDPQFYQELKWSVVNAFQQLGYIRLSVEPSELFEAHGIQTLAYQIAYDSSASFDDLMMLCKCPSGISFTLTTDERSQVRIRERPVENQRGHGGRLPAYIRQKGEEKREAQRSAWKQQRNPL